MEQPQRLVQPQMAMAAAEDAIVGDGRGDALGLRGDFGYSYVSEKPALDEILPRIPITAKLAGLALLFFAGRFSHAIRKGPLLRPNDAAIDTLAATRPWMDTTRLGAQGTICGGSFTYFASPS